MYIANTSQIREADRIQIEDKKLPGILLMESAGRQAAECLLRLYPNQKSFLVLAGPGNNGGDGLVMARYLHLAGRKVEILFSHDPKGYKGDAALNYQVLCHLPVEAGLFDEERAKAAIQERPLLVDALLGTGIRALLREPISGILDFFRPLGLTTVAVDVPSGLDADTGACINEVLPAAHTFTFQLPKICHVVTPAANFCGEIHVIDIGIWPEVIKGLDIRRRWVKEDFVREHYHPRKSDSHKGNYGHLLVAGGSRPMAGAIAMAAFAAQQSGAGLVTAFLPSACQQALNNLCPESMCLPVAGDRLGGAAVSEFQQALEGKTVVALGPGLGKNEDTLAFLRGALPLIHQPLILDADALNLVAEHPELWDLFPKTVILTPHPGEMRRLMDDAGVNDHRLELAEKLAEKRNVVVVLKGKGTLSCMPDGATFVNSSGNPGMAAGGTGDVLTGLLGSLLAQGYLVEVAAPLAVYLHGKAADLMAEEKGEEGVMATGIATRISQAWKLSRNTRPC